MTNDDDVFDYINTVKNQGQSEEKFIHNVLGYNYRMTNIQAAILYGQLLDLDIILNKKKEIFQYYKNNLKNVEYLEFQKIIDNTAHSNWMFGIRFTNFDLEKTKDLQLFLYKNGIETRPMFYDIKKHSYLTNIKCETKNAEILQSQCIILPSFPNLTKSQIIFICNTIKKYQKNAIFEI
jgi:dTDP-4-amino-4,6-dideoxygalactose transaminase